MTKVQKITKHIITLYDGDIYILEGYTSPQSIWDAIGKMSRIQMPNGDLIATSSISKIQSYESYAFQKDAGARHKRGQFLKGGSWYDNQGEVCDARLGSISGVIQAMLPESTATRLSGGA